MNPVLANRPMSGFPVSISTSLALETLFKPIQPVYDENREVKSLSDLSTYSLYVFNVSTLLRNIINSIHYKDLVLISKQDIYDTLLEEISFINDFFNSNNLSVKFYINTYKYLKDTLKGTDKLRTSNTDKQIFIDGIYSYCLDRLRKEGDVDIFHKDIHYNKEDKVLLFTHIPFDLLSHSNFIKFDLLESHTGVIKSRKDWWSKYYPIPNKDMSFLPFFEYLLIKFGDHVMIHPDPVKDRLEIYEAMKKKNVNPLTSELALMLKL